MKKEDLVEGKRYRVTSPINISGYDSGNSTLFPIGYTFTLLGGGFPYRFKSDDGIEVEIDTWADAILDKMVREE